MIRAKLPREVQQSLRDFQTVQTRIARIAQEARAGTLGLTETKRLNGEEIAADVFADLRRDIINIGAEPVAEGQSLRKVTHPYVLACYADEAMMHLIDWPGAPHWSKFLLERSLFGSRIAGERVMDTAEELLASRETGARDLAMTVYLAIASGFQGRHRGEPDDGTLERLERGLYDLAVGRSPPLGIEWAPILSKAHGHTIIRPPRTPDRSVERWRLAFVAVIAGYLGLSYALWQWNLSEIDSLADRVNDARATLIGTQ